MYPRPVPAAIVDSPDRFVRRESAQTITPTERAKSATVTRSFRSQTNETSLPRKGAARLCRFLSSRRLQLVPRVLATEGHRAHAPEASGVCGTCCTGSISSDDVAGQQAIRLLHVSTDTKRREGSLRLLRRYENITQAAHPVHAKSRQDAKAAAAFAESAFAARVALAAIENDTARQYGKQSAERQAQNLFAFEPIPLTVEPDQSFFDEHGIWCARTPASTPGRQQQAKKLSEPSTVGTRQVRDRSEEAWKDAQRKARFQVSFDKCNSLEFGESNRDARSLFAGTIGRLRFFHAYKDAFRLLQQTNESSRIKGKGSNDGIWIAREFCEEIIRQNIPPTPALLKQFAGGTLRLRGLGLKDGVAHAIALVLPRLRHILRIDVAENHLGDAALSALCQAVTYQCPQLVLLDMSQNIVGNCTAAAVKEMLASGHQLRTLCLGGADVDDADCVELTRSLAGNVALTELNLSKNLIGRIESTNTVNPDVVTGPEALAQAFESCNTRLNTLNLSWNYIRLESARALGSSLGYVHSITNLRLEHNSFGDEATQYLAAALHKNTSIEILDLSYNSVEPAAALVLATMLKVNDTLMCLKLDGNPIGKNGARALLSALQTRQRHSAQETSDSGHLDNHVDRELRISIRQCESVRDGRVRYFDPKQPTGSYRLNLLIPFDRMVALELLWMASNRRDCGFNSLRYFSAHAKELSTKEQPDGANDPLREELGREIKLHRANKPDSVRNMRTWRMLKPPRVGGTCPPWATIVARISSCNNVQCADLEAILAWLGFDMEKDHTDFVTRQMQVNLMRDPRALQSKIMFSKLIIMQSFWKAIFRLAEANDPDCINAQEFEQLLAKLGVVSSPQNVSLIVAEFNTDDTTVIEEEDFVQFAIAAFESESERPTTKLCENGDVPWTLPKDGWLDVVFECQPATPSADQCGSDTGVRALLYMMRDISSELERAAIFDVMTSDADLFLTREQAHNLFESARPGYSKIEKMSRILPQVVTHSDCCALIDRHLSSSEKVQLMDMLGPAWGVLLGNPTGHYALDMRNANDRLAWRRLAGIAYSEKSQSQLLESGDTSQHGNWLNFRNERWQGKAIHLTPGWFDQDSVKGKDGMIHFDYVSTTRPRPAARPMSRRRFSTFLQIVGMCRGGECSDVRGNDESDTEEFDVYSSPLCGKATDAVARHWREFMTSSRWYTSWHLYVGDDRGSWAEGAQIHAKEGSVPPENADLKSMQRPRSESQTGKAQKTRSKTLLKEATLTASEDMTRAVVNNAAVKPPMSQLRSRPLLPLNPSEAYRQGILCLQKLKANMGQFFFSAAQVRALVDSFPQHDFLRVQLILAFFCRITDLDEFATVVDSLTSEEREECLHRIGIMNCYNAMQVDRVYSLSLSSHDERQMAVVLVKLAIEQPGENWVGERYTRRVDSLEWIPGWQLPKEWDDEVANQGILETRYISYAAQSQEDLSVRTSLMPMFLCGRRGFLREDAANVKIS